MPVCAQKFAVRTQRGVIEGVTHAAIEYLPGSKGSRISYVRLYKRDGPDGSSFELVKTKNNMSAVEKRALVAAINRRLGYDERRGVGGAAHGAAVTNPMMMTGKAVSPAPPPAALLSSPFGLAALATLHKIQAAQDAKSLLLAFDVRWCNCASAVALLGGRGSPLLSLSTHALQELKGQLAVAPPLELTPAVVEAIRTTCQQKGVASRE